MIKQCVQSIILISCMVRFQVLKMFLLLLFVSSNCKFLLPSLSTSYSRNCTALLYGCEEIIQSLHSKRNMIKHTNEVF